MLADKRVDGVKKFRSLTFDRVPEHEAEKRSWKPLDKGSTGLVVVLFRLR